MKRGQLDSSVLILVTLGLVAFGLVMVYSATSASAALANGDPAYYLKRQGIYAALGLVLMAAASRHRPPSAPARWSLPPAPPGKARRRGTGLGRAPPKADDAGGRMLRARRLSVLTCTVLRGARLHPLPAPPL